jgi:amidase
MVRLHTPWPPGLIGHPHQYDIPSNLSPESLCGPNAGLTEVLVPAGYVMTVYDPVFPGSKEVSRDPVAIKEAIEGLMADLVFELEAENSARNQVGKRVTAGDRHA